MSEQRRPAIEGGIPIRSAMLPYGRHSITDEDVRRVESVLRGDWLTTGPTIHEFERALRRMIGATDVVAVNSGTAALHAACAALDLAPGDEVILPSLTFVASANAILYVGATPVFAEVSPDTLTLNADDVERRLSARTRAIMVVHYAGLPADLSRFHALARDRGLRIIEDAAHALGAERRGSQVGRSSDFATFSFHPVKHVTTAEGGAVATNSTDQGARMRRFRNHGLSADVQTRERAKTWLTEMVALGFNYRLSDLSAALGLSQLERLADNLKRRRELARKYRAAFADLDTMASQEVDVPDGHAWHIYAVRIDPKRLRVDRDAIMRALRAEGIGVNLHFPPVHLHPFYRERFGFGPGCLPVTEDVCARLITLPLFPSMSDQDQMDVITAVRRVLGWYRARGTRVPSHKLD